VVTVIIYKPDETVGPITPVGSSTTKPASATPAAVSG
jgi:hypothetical protein